MSGVVFLVSKSPYSLHEDGETRVSKLLLEAAAECGETSALALADEPAPPGPVPVREIDKPVLRIGPTALASLRGRRSLIHARFAPPEYVRAVASLDAEVLVARRLYMAQAAIDSARVPAVPLLALADVLESSVLRQRPGRGRVLLRAEARRTWRDEVRCAQAGAVVAALSDTERVALAPHLHPRPERLDLVLDAAAAPAGARDPVALFIGDLHWAPNREAATALADVWPEIARRCPAARLVMAGRGTDDGPGPPAGERVTRLGFVEDLEPVWAGTGVLLAPVTIGGGVRVKILDAARRGVPVVATPAAAGSVDEYLPIVRAETRQDFVAAAAGLLADRTARRAAGEALYETNAGLCRSGFVEEQMARLLSAARQRHA
jgi:glycosyltransferase involved in cell wall biosynthesis